MKSRNTLSIVTIFTSCFFFAVNASNAEQTSTSEKSGDDHPLHQQLLETLQNTSSVAPSLPGLHPVHAVYNREGIIPPQCYTRTEGEYNPCYICHQNAIEGRENVMNDRALQVAYSFSDLGMTNHWQNLFEDRRDKGAAISDKDIIEWVDQDNYSALPARLRDAGFKGWIPDLRNLQKAARAFDKNGFAKDGSHWVAFNYKPVPSTFWPTNGSTDDVMIRLPEAYRTNKDGNYSKDAYRANLAILEANIKGLRSIGSLPVNEQNLSIDLNADGELGKVSYITEVSHFVGGAEGLRAYPYLYPEGTEFLHTVRYIGVDGKGEISVPARMKEVRYMRKWSLFGKRVYARQYQLEAFEKEAGNLPRYHFLGDYGLDNGYGWAIQGFIEDRKGRLRANTFEENLFCMGCHTSIGSTIDKTFSFARKLDGAAGWGYINLKGMPDAPNMGETQGEILTYLERVGGGSEFRNNEEMRDRWFTKEGTVDRKKVSAASDVYQLITPSRERALMLNKAYRVIVEEQDFIYGRDASVAPPANVYEEIDNENTPTLPPEKTYDWDIRLDWNRNNQQ